MSAFAPEGPHWAVEIPTVAVQGGQPKEVPHVLLVEGDDRLPQFDIVSGAARPLDLRTLEAVRVPYVNNDPTQGLAEDCVAVNDAGGRGIGFDPTDRHALEMWWQQEGIQAAFFSDDAARECDLDALVDVRAGTFELTQDRFSFHVTSQGLVIASLRTLVQREFAARNGLARRSRVS
ncbi:MAG TPA: hypothetical protein VF466_03800 [Candidatus Saccharimonadales bacterium]